MTSLCSVNNVFWQPRLVIISWSCVWILPWRLSSSLFLWKFANWVLQTQEIKESVLITLVYSYHYVHYCLSVEVMVRTVSAPSSPSISRSGSVLPMGDLSVNSTGISLRRGFVNCNSRTQDSRESRLDDPVAQTAITVPSSCWCTKLCLAIVFSVGGENSGRLRLLTSETADQIV